MTRRENLEKLLSAIRRPSPPRDVDTDDPAVAMTTMMGMMSGEGPYTNDSYSGVGESCSPDDCSDVLILDCETNVCCW